MPEEVMQCLAPRKADELMIQANMGEGGHAELFLERFPELRVTGIDADGAILEIARERLARFGSRVNYFQGWSQDFFAGYPVDSERPASVFFDLGISSYHYEKAGRGFSFKSDEPLDMRIDPGLETSAADLVKRLAENDLADLIYQNGEERYSRRIARAIVQARRQGAITTAAELARIVEGAVPASYRHGPIHPATRTFQALRIAVNHELDTLPALLASALSIVENGGKMGVISFHSLEDRLVKQFFRGRDYSKHENTPIDRKMDFVKILTKKPLSPGLEEVRRNPASRSAKFRAAEKYGGEAA
jgi:16S rRNA (cytosine1402-N4)-methyltransferase